jgi:hypothetical protein
VLDIFLGHGAWAIVDQKLEYSTICLEQHNQPKKQNWTKLIRDRELEQRRKIDS